LEFLNILHKYLFLVQIDEFIIRLQKQSLKYNKNGKSDLERKAITFLKFLILKYIYKICLIIYFGREAKEEVNNIGSDIFIIFKF